MPNLTIAVSKDLKELIDRHPETNCSEVARKAIRERLILLEEMDKLLANSKLTEKDAIILGRKVNKAVAKKHLDYVKEHS